MCAEIKAFDLPDAVVDVAVVHKARATCEVQMFAIGGKSRVVAISDLAAFGELDARSTEGMMEPDLDGSDAAAICDSSTVHKVPTIGGKDGRVGGDIFVLGQRAGMFAVAIHDPSIVAPATIACEEDVFSVWREAGLDVISRALGKARCDPARYRESIEIAQKIKHKGLAVRGKVKVHPCAFVGLKADRRRRQGWQFFG